MAKLASSNKIIKLAEKAAWEATESTMTNRHGAVLFKQSGGHVISGGCNSTDRSQFRGRTRASMHAEITACLGSRRLRHLSHCSRYVVRHQRERCLLSSKVVSARGSGSA